MSDVREVIAAGKQRPPWFLHLVPVARFLVKERGHMPIDNPEEFGFVQMRDGYRCHLTRQLTVEDWAAINDRFELPETIGFFRGLIRDNDNWVDIMGHDTIISGGGQIPIAVGRAAEREVGPIG